MTNYCPECRDGKHANCDETALDDQADRIVSCQCEHAIYRQLPGQVDIFQVINEGDTE